MLAHRGRHTTQTMQFQNKEQIWITRNFDKIYCFDKPEVSNQTHLQKFDITLVDIKLLRVLKSRYATGVLEQKLAVSRIRVDYLTTECTTVIGQLILQLLAFLDGSPKVILLQVYFREFSKQTIGMQFLQMLVLNHMARILLFRT